MNPGQWDAEMQMYECAWCEFRLPYHNQVLHHMNSAHIHRPEPYCYHCRHRNIIKFKYISGCLPCVGGIRGKRSTYRTNPLKSGSLPTGAYEKPKYDKPKLMISGKPRPVANHELSQSPRLPENGRLPENDEIRIPGNPSQFHFPGLGSPINEVRNKENKLEEIKDKAILELEKDLAEIGKDTTLDSVPGTSSTEWGTMPGTSQQPDSHYVPMWNMGNAETFPSGNQAPGESEVRNHGYEIPNELELPISSTTTKPPFSEFGINLNTTWGPSIEPEIREPKIEITELNTDWSDQSHETRSVILPVLPLTSPKRIRGMCPYCNTELAWSSLRDHIKTKHPQNVLKCLYCKQNFVYQAALDKHMDKAHIAYRAHQHTETTVKHGNWNLTSGVAKYYKKWKSFAECERIKAIQQ